MSNKMAYKLVTKAAEKQKQDMAASCHDFCSYGWSTVQKKMDTEEGPGQWLVALLQAGCNSPFRDSLTLETLCRTLTVWASLLSGLDPSCCSQRIKAHHYN